VAPKSLADRREKKARTDRSTYWLLAEKDLRVAAIFLSCVLDKFSIHTGLVISVIFGLSGFPASSRSLLGKPLKQP